MNEFREEAATVDEAAEPGVDADGGGASAVPEGESTHGVSSHNVPGSDFGYWLTGSLRPSASKSVSPPVAPAWDDAPVATPETLAPQMMTSEELDEEDLAVLPMGARRSGSRSWLGKFTVAALGAAVAVLMFGYLWWQEAAEPSSDATPSAVASVPAAVAHEPTTLTPGDTKTPDPEHDSTAARTSLGRWLPPVTPQEGDNDETSRGPRGPSVARFPDLPAAVWSYLRHAERERAKPSSADSGAAESATSQPE